MDTPFEKLSAEERSEWRMNPMTMAYLATLRENLQVLREQTLDLVKGGCGADRLEYLASLGGELKALEFFLMLAAKE